MLARPFMECQNVNFVRISISKPSALGLTFFSVTLRRPQRPSVNPWPGVRMWSSRRWRVSRRASPLSLPLSPEHVRASSPVEYAHNYLYPSPEARDTVSLGLEDVLFTAASDSEDFGPALADALAPSRGVAFRGQLWAHGCAFARHRKALYRLAWWALRVSIVQTRRAFP